MCRGKEAWGRRSGGRRRPCYHRIGGRGKGRWSGGQGEEGQREEWGDDWMMMRGELGGGGVGGEGGRVAGLDGESGASTTAFQVVAVHSAETTRDTHEEGGKCREGDGLWGS